MKWKYILKRILIAIPTFFGITILAYFILNMAPGSPLDALLADPGITPAELERKRVALGNNCLREIWDFPTAPRDRWQR